MVMVALGFYLCICVWVLKEGRAELSGLLNKFGGGVSGERIFELEDFLASDLWEWQIYLVDLRKIGRAHV